MDSTALAFTRRASHNQDALKSLSCQHNLVASPYLSNSCFIAFLTFKHVHNFREQESMLQSIRYQCLCHHPTYRIHALLLYRLPNMSIILRSIRNQCLHFKLCKTLAAPIELSLCAEEGYLCNFIGRSEVLFPLRMRWATR